MHTETPPPVWPPYWPDVTDKAVLAALKAVPRHIFVLPQHRVAAYEDIPLSIGHGQTISQPYIVARMTQALCLTAASRVLEIGTGSGYQAAILAQITPHVWSVEALPELARAADERLTGLGCQVAIKVGDGRLGWPEHAPYDAIIVTAAAPDVPPSLVAQLAEGGRLVIPVGADAWRQVLWLISKRAGRPYASWLGDVRFVPLVGSHEAAAAENDPALAALRDELAALLRRQNNPGEI